jgi:MYXO-CTERM domain-containing protein
MAEVAVISRTAQSRAGRSPRVGVLSTSIAFGALVALVASNASAFCRTTTCDPMNLDASCTLDENDCPDSGIPLTWPNGCLSYSVNDEGSPLRGVTYDEAQDLTDLAVSRWMNADCGNGQKPSLEAIGTSPASCETTGFVGGEGGNVNLIVFRDDDWPYAGTGAVLAFTTLNYDTRNGHILDADIEINSEFSELTTSDSGITDDLDSILTHEFGHFFGLSHVADEEATMYASYTPGEQLKRSLNSDDIAGICSIYPPGANVSFCDPEPHGGYKASCFAPAAEGCPQVYVADGFNPNCLPEDDGGCSVTAPSPKSPTPWLIAGVVALGALVRRRVRT